VLDTEQLLVREAVGADVLSWEDARRGEARPLGALHVVEGTSATLVVRWQTRDGAPMSGGDILSVAGPASLAPESGFDGVNEILRLSPGTGTRGTHTLALSAVDREVRTVDVVVHARDEVDQVGLELGPSRVSRRTAGFVDGTVFSVVRAGDEVMNGAEVAFTWAGGEGEGDTLDFAASAGPATDVQACFDDVCNTFPLPAGVVAVRDEEAELTDGGDCGCTHAGGAPVGLAAAALLAGLRRRRPLPR
jgi:MYXO-CTERM domain-containing protein